MQGENTIKKLKPFLCLLINYYYNIPGNEAGGNLHIILDDGNNKDFIEYCKQRAKDNGDSLGMLLCDLLNEFSDDKLFSLYLKNWKR